MNVEHRERTGEGAARLGFADCDIHPKVRRLEDLRPYLSERWWRHYLTYGPRVRHGFAKGTPYPKAAPLACRRDAWPADGGEPGSSLELMREQLIDAYGLEFGVLNPLSPTGQGYQDADFSAAMASATNGRHIVR